MQKHYSLNEANNLIKELLSVTEEYSSQVEYIIKKLDRLENQSPEAEKLEIKVNSLINEWQNKTQGMGAVPKGLWMCDIDSGDGYYCWKYPEKSIDYKHSYTEGFSKRVKITDDTVLRIVRI